MTPTQQQAADLAAQLRAHDLRTGAEADRSPADGSFRE